MSRAKTLGSVTSVLLCLVAGAACSSAPEVEERPPDAFGWVVDWERSADYRYDPVADAVTAGSVVLTLEDGVSVAVATSTDLSGPTCAVLRDGTVLPFDRSRVEVAVLGVPDPSIDDALDRLAPQGLCDFVADQETGAVILLDCRLPY